jgi:histone deacetylase 1/2
LSSVLLCFMVDQARRPTWRLAVAVVVVAKTVVVEVADAGMAMEVAALQMENVQLTCQLGGKEGHTVLRCYKRFYSTFNGPVENKSASTATTSYGVDTNWYSDTGATDHITGELEKLAVREKYHGGDQVHAANGSGMEIDQIGLSKIRTPSGNFLLKDVLYVPQASKNSVSVHKLARDNHAFFEFHPNFFLINDQTMKTVLRRGPCEGGLYPLRSNKEAHSIVKPPSSRWHNRLGHPSSSVVHQVLSKNKLPFVQDANKESICHACQKSKPSAPLSEIH